MEARGNNLKKPMLWKDILVYKQTIAICLSRFVTDWVWWFFLFWTPAYLNKNLWDKPFRNDPAPDHYLFRCRIWGDCRRVVVELFDTIRKKCGLFEKNSHPDLRSGCAPDHFRIPNQ